MVQAHVIRFIPPFRPEEASTPHYHDVDFQMVYVLQGWYKAEFEGEGVHTFEAGSCWIQPPGIEHTVLGYSDDCELLEIVLPADFETVTLEEA
jgi:quercetin dioxygenase-like cupin family protein